MKEVLNKKFGFWNGVTLIIYGLVITFTLVTLLTRFAIGGMQILTVRSGSMEPAIKTGSVVVVKKAANYQIGDIVTIKESGSSQTVTHRISDFKQSAEGILFTSKGDANENPDSEQFTSSDLIGKVILNVPYLGYPVAFAQTLPGLFILIIIPAIVIILDEISNIRRLLISKKAVKEKGKKTLRFIKVTILFLGIFILFGASTKAFFISRASIVNNQASTGILPSQPHMVINEVYYDVDSTHGKEGKNEWIEFYNGSNETIRMKHWTVTTSAGTIIDLHSNRHIKPGQLVLLTHDSSTWSKWKKLPNNAIKLYYAGRTPINWLGDTTDTVTLKDQSGNLIDQISYTTGTVGHSWERMPVGYDTDEIGDFIDQLNPTPGIGL
jgi:signal peptidase